ncbi:hypothetical protein JVT61DRAFT_9718 [Boletus reticuloceps]|uniref:Uncharacterized protein n=1 Tax=Boletus reticuloceps TaxID=495285 RepID=A0A8I3A5L9_9AGAM|nr:hypothetical protein JVT61DRAFT_9718 [Boletus reticuloceps]
MGPPTDAQIAEADFNTNQIQEFGRGNRVSRPTERLQVFHAEQATRYDRRTHRASTNRTEGASLSKVQDDPHIYTTDMVTGGLLRTCHTGDDTLGGMVHSDLESVNTDPDGNIGYSMMPWSALAPQFVASSTTEEIPLSEGLQAHSYGGGSHFEAAPGGSATASVTDNASRVSYSPAGFINDPQAEQETPAEDELVANLSTGSQTSASASGRMAMVS